MLKFVAQMLGGVHAGKLMVRQLEAGIVRHCINRCVGCNHFSPVCDPWFMEPEDLRRDLRLLTRFVVPRKMALLGGEPLLHPRIDDILEMMGEFHFHELSVVTNGQLIRRMSERFWRLTPKLEVDIYPGKMTESDIQFIKQKCREHRITLLLVPSTHFYKSLSPPGQTAEQCQQRFDKCPTRRKCYCIDSGYFYKCPQASLVPRMFTKLTEHIDGVSLETMTLESVQAYLANKQALHSCARCNVECGRTPWREVSREHWVDESTQ